jgi:hypothetical protein
MNNTSLPRFTGGWMLTPGAAEHFQKAHILRVKEARDRGVSMPEIFPEYHSADMPAFRRWEDGKWRTIEQSLYGGEVWEDAAGGLWHFRVREAEVTFPDGRRQLIPLDAGTAKQFHLAVESEDAVWVASQQSLCRFCLERNECGRPSRWAGERVFRLPCFGVGFVGPWIAGESLYYLSAGKLFHVKMDELGVPANRTAFNARELPKLKEDAKPVIALHWPWRAIHLGECRPRRAREGRGICPAADGFARSSHGWHKARPVCRPCPPEN